jgi:hypothetical protein
LLPPQSFSSQSASVPAEVVVQLVARNEAGADTARDGPQLTAADQCANLVLGAAQLDGNLADREGCGPLHPRSIAAPPAAAAATGLLDVQAYARSGLAHYIFNLVRGEALDRPEPHEQAAEFLRIRMWGIGAGEPHGSALETGDLVLIYLGAPNGEFVGRAELASPVHEWTPTEAQVYPGDSRAGVLLAQVEKWQPPVPMKTVLSQIDSPEARADFEAGVVRITSSEYETAVAVATGRTPSTGAP